MIYLIHSKNFCKYHNTAPPEITIKKKKKKTVGRPQKNNLKQKGPEVWLKWQSAFLESIMNPSTTKFIIIIIITIIIIDK
jgi:hypothetical protein